MNEVTGSLKVTHIWESLDKIADKIGMTVEQLWPYLVKQVYNEAMLGAVAIFIGFLISLFILIKYGHMGFSKWGEEEVEDYQKPCTIFPLLIMALLLIVFIFADLPRFLNPEYFAFEDLMNMLRKVN